MNSYSQAGQDLWVYEMLDHAHSGFFVDLGCNDPVKHNNTLGLEQLGWKGLCVDIVDGCENRKATFIKSDAAAPNEKLRLYYKHLPPVVDYLSLDCDNATLGAFRAIPWPAVTFRVMTIETDVYAKGTAERDDMRAALKHLGYELCCADVVVEWPLGTFVSYEDWWVHPDHTNPDNVNRFKSDGKHWKDILGIK